MRGLFSPNRTVALLALAAALGACEGTPASVPEGPARLVIVAGDGQRGLAGEALLRPVEVLVTDDDGRPLAGRQVQFELLSGTGSISPAAVTTGPAGSARAQWTLGEQDVRIQRLRVAIDGADSASLLATALGPDETDVVIVHGALGAMKGIVLVQEGSGGILTIIQERISPDSVISIFPMDSGTTGIVAFPTANAPAWASANWTSGIDTVRVDLRPPIPIAVVVTVAAEPFAARRETVERHLTELRRIWSDQGVGLELDVVEIVDATNGVAGLEVPADGACAFGRVIPGRIHVYYVERLGGSVTRGLACPPGLAFVAAGPGSSESLLAHEIGHLLGLDHVQFGLMQPLTVETSLSEGQVFRVHFSKRSALNLVFSAWPAEALRDCDTSVGPGCLHIEYELP